MIVFDFPPNFIAPLTPASMAVDHYENFPVASLLLPAHLRPAVEAIYAFARSADDLADEGDATPAERLASLEAYTNELVRIEQNHDSDQPLFQKLKKIIDFHGLPLQPFHDLLSAFKQDVVTSRYATYDLLADYCRRSANPVGTLMLALYEASTEQNRRDSDAICSSLQLINFWQDVAIDAQKGRIYIPQEDLIRIGIAEEQLLQGPTSATSATGATGASGVAWRELMRFEVARARHLLESGAPLAVRLPGRIGWELRMVVQGGLRILERIEAIHYDVYLQRPQLGRGDWMPMLWRAWRM